MGTMLDLLDGAFGEIMEDGVLFLDEDFMMNIFKTLHDKVDPFKEYAQYMFEQKQGNSVSGCVSHEDKVLPLDVLRAALFAPTRMDIRQTTRHCTRFAEISACVFRIEFRDTSKCTSKYLSAIKGKYSNAVLSDEDKEAGMRKEATNSISESGHARSTYGLKINGTVRLDHAAGEGQ